MQGKDTRDQGKGGVGELVRAMAGAIDHERGSEGALIERIKEFNQQVNQETNGSTGIPPMKLIKKEMEHLDPIPNKALLGSYIQNVSV